MNRRLAAALAAASVAATTSPAPAIDLGLGLFKKKKPPEAQPAPSKADPSSRVKQLIATVQSDPDVDRRKAAVGELAGHDPRTSPEVVTALVYSLQKDPSPDIRAKAAETLGGYRTVYTTAATALESAEAGDPDKAVRAAAKSALWQYGLNGYKVSAGNASTQTAEPPLAKLASRPSSPPPSVSAKTPVNGTDATFRPITQGPAGKATPFQQSAEPPLAKSGTPVSQPTPPVTVAPPPGVPQRMPTKIDTPVNPPKLDVPAASLPDEKKTVAPPTSAEPEKKFPLPLPSLPSVPQQMPTVAPPGK